MTIEEIEKLVLVNYGEARPVVVYRKKNGEWGEREYTLYSWDLP